MGIYDTLYIQAGVSCCCSYAWTNEKEKSAESQLTAHIGKSIRFSSFNFPVEPAPTPASTMSIMSYNGSAIIAMKGKDCVAIASDLRFGQQLRTVTTDFPKVFEIEPHLWVGLPGLATDIETVLEKLKFLYNMYALKEGRKMSPKTFAAMLSNMLYERRFGPFFVEPIVAGLEGKDKKPFICSMDLIGCQTMPEDFVVSGTSEDQLYGKSL